MTCDGLEERIARYVGGDLAPKEAAELEQHLRSCADCEELARGLEGDRAWLASRPAEIGDVDFAAMRREIRREIGRPRWGWRWLTAAAAILLLVGVAITLRKPHEPGSVAIAPPPGRPAVVVAQSPLPSSIRKEGDLHVRMETPSRRNPIKRVPEDAGVRPAELERQSLADIGSPVEIRLATRDPNVTIILVHETKGVTQ